MNNSKRQIVKIMTEICNEYSIDLNLLFTEWVMQLTHNQKRMYITGYQFPNNNSASARLCDDKSALCSILTENKIPAILHEYFMTPFNKFKIKIDDHLDSILKMLKKYGTIVCKMNTGTGGNHVYKVSTKEDIISAIQEIYKHSDLAVCPFYNFENEYRIIVLNNKAELIYKKDIPYIVGDGIKTFGELCTEIKQNISVKKEDNLESDALKIDEYGRYNEYDIVPKNIRAYAGWKHNLALGASASIIEEPELIEKLTHLALKAASIIDINLASVDIVQMENQLYILEINSGIVLEKFSLQSDDDYQKAKRIYEKAVTSYFNIEIL